jgi:hypothetical protein
VNYPEGNIHLKMSPPDWLFAKKNQRLVNEGRKEGRKE